MEKHASRVRGLTPFDVDDEYVRGNVGSAGYSHRRTEPLARSSVAPLARSSTAPVSGSSSFGFGMAQEKFVRKTRTNSPVRTAKRSVAIGSMRSVMAASAVAASAESSALDDLESKLPLKRNESMALTQWVASTAADEKGNLNPKCLENAGITTEQLARVFYSRYRDDHVPLFLERINFHSNGGFDRLEQIWSNQKYVWFLVLVCQVLFNVASLSYTNGVLCASFLDQAVSHRTNMTYAVDAVLADDKFPISSVSHFRKIEDPFARSVFFSVAAVVAVWELGWLLAKVLECLWFMRQFFTVESEYCAYHSIVTMFQQSLPDLATFSLIRLITKAHPHIVTHEYLRLKAESSWRGKWYGTMAFTTLFGLKCLFCITIAVSAFSVKTLAAALKLIDPLAWTPARIVSMFSLLNQCLGVIILDIVLKDRLFLFIFGGQDADYRDDERAFMYVYEARLAKEIWLVYWASGRFLQAIVMIATFDHYDLQQLVIEDIQVDVELASPSRSTAKHMFTIWGEDDEDDETEEVDVGLASPSRRSARHTLTTLVKSNETEEVDVGPASPSRRPTKRALTTLVKSNEAKKGFVTFDGVPCGHERFHMERDLDPLTELNEYTRVNGSPPSSIPSGSSHESGSDSVDIASLDSAGNRDAVGAEHETEMRRLSRIFVDDITPKSTNSGSIEI
eukprot:TRINITY_DN7027_c0_g1_i2.p1 TRINITY_DN7027_c0_g1~~TRINITY_DN7027_c0_g1_i2.p1  ORF type:complete len:678 (-),score=85.42 TRINITY_DN7027_c0_g1_i2:52-2085(-)